MTEISSNNKKIAKNTIALYTRNLISMIIGLFTVRVVLRTLGETDYGIYSVVAGSIAFLTFISFALSYGSQRFFAFTIGREDKRALKDLFEVTVTLYVILVAVIILAAESIGIWFINTHLVILPERLFAANVIFQFVIISTGITLLTSPYTMAIMAHEDMHIFAKLAIVDAIFKIGICVIIIYIPFDKLISYVFMMLVGTIFVQSIYVIYARRKYEECCIKRLKWDKSKAKEMTSFSFWNLFGSLAGVGKTQGLGIVLNSFFGPIVNAAQGVATTVRTVSSSFSSNFSSALAPQITKKYANQDYDGMSLLLQRGSKMTYFLMLIVVVPILFSIDFILQIWIGEHSVHMAPFCQLLLFEALIDSISTPLATANQATGKIARYQAIIGFFGLMTLPFAYVLMRFGYAPEWVFIVSLIMQLCIVCVRIIFLHRIYPGAVRGALKNIVVPCTVVTLIVFSACWIQHIEVTDFITFIGAVVDYVIVCIIVIWVFGLTKDESAKFKDLIIKMIKNK